MSKIKGLFILLAFAFSFESGAIPASKFFKQPVFNCFIIGILDNPDDTYFEFDFLVDLNKQAAGSHGGPERTFTYKNNEVIAIANDRWLGLAWWRDGKKIAEAVNLQTDSNLASRVLIALNPSNDEERVSITCDLVVEKKKPQP